MEEQSTRLHRRERERIALFERASLISFEERRNYVSVAALAKTLKKDEETIKHILLEEQTPICKFAYRGSYVLVLTQEEAELFLQSYPQREAKTPLRIPPGRPPGRKPTPIGTSERCGVCRKTSGNILAVHDSNHRVRAYLCTPCYRVATSYKWEPRRMKLMAKVIEAVGLEHLQS